MLVQRGDWHVHACRVKGQDEDGTGCCSRAFEFRVLRAESLFRPSQAFKRQSLKQGALHHHLHQNKEGESCGMLAGSKGSVRIKQAAVVQLPSAMRGGLESLFRASQAFNPQSLKPGRLARITSLGRQSPEPILYPLLCCLLMIQ